MKRALLHSVVLALLLSNLLSASGAQPTLSIQSGVKVSWATIAGATYRVQWSSTPGNTDSWTSLSGLIIGNGQTNSLYDPFVSGARSYRVIEIIPGSTSSAIPVNGGFELGSGTTAANWSTTGSQAPVRSSAQAHNGAFSMHASLTNVTASPTEARLSQNVVAQGGTISVNQTYTLSFWARQVASGPSYVQQYQVQWLNNVGGVIGGSGLVNFSGTVGNWTQITVPNLVAPAAAVDVRIQFRFVTGAIAGGHGQVFLDDVALASSGGNGGPGQTNILNAALQPVARVSWPMSLGSDYQPESSGSFADASWTTLTSSFSGTTQYVLVPIADKQQFIRLKWPRQILPPTNLRVIPTGATNAISIAWDPVFSNDFVYYRVVYGTTEGVLNQSLAVEIGTTATITGLNAGQAYYLAVIAWSSEGESEPSQTIRYVVPATSDIVPLFDANTLLEPPTTIDTATALVTHVADRARDRHAREGMFSAYDHYLTWYWEERTIAIKIEDRVAKGGTNITFTYDTLTPLGAPEFRAFFRGINTVAEYHFNLLAPLIGSNRYTATLNRKLPENRALQVGDRIEIEISQFIDAPIHGRANYYGTAILYVVGQGIVPWQGVGPLLDSFPLPENAWLGGQTTLPYQYSNEPEHRFKQTAGNIAPTNAQPFMLGRRLHHTDFGSGAHSESGNPIFSEHVGKLGPKFIAQSCVQCHVNNGRALSPAVNAPMNQSVVKVGTDANGSPHPVLGSVLQPKSTTGSAEGNVVIGNYAPIQGQYGDGTPYTLRMPSYTFDGASQSYFSVRLAPPLVGLGLLEAVSEETIIGLSDPNDADGDGISGRVQTVIDPENGSRRVGRFTAKGGKARLSHQIASALNTDMGVTTSIFPTLDGGTTNGAPELSDDDLDKMTRYVALLGVSARRDLTNSEALRGEQLFTTAQCTKCHQPSLVTSPFHPMAELRSQTIRPFTDLLLHDMGSGLADNMGELGASGSEWRTPPLWSIGLTAGVSGGEAYLHDGRARTLEEAILWHGGEGEASKEIFRTMPATDRAALIEFLKSL